MQLISSFKQAEENAIRFSDVLNHKESITFSRLGKFFHWYYFPNLDIFAPSKFIGYENTTLNEYEGLGTGSDTTKKLKSWLHKLEKNTSSYRGLEEKLEVFISNAGVTKSKKISDGTGGIYVPLSPFAITSFPDDVTDEDYYEGAVKDVLVNTYERNPKARAACIAHYGCVCQVCKFDFAKRYGEIGRGFIHVHHLVEMSSIGEEYIVDPVLHLRPLCPNCHAMIHRTKPAMSIDELKAQLENA